MKEKELRGRIARLKTQGITGEYEVFVRTRNKLGQVIISRIFEVKCDHISREFTIETIETEYSNLPEDDEHIR